MCAFCGMLYSNVTHGRGKRGGVGGGGGGLFLFFSCCVSLCEEMVLLS